MQQCRKPKEKVVVVRQNKPATEGGTPGPAKAAHTLQGTPPAKRVAVVATTTTASRVTLVVVLDAVHNNASRETEHTVHERVARYKKKKYDPRVSSHQLAKPTSATRPTG